MLQLQRFTLDLVSFNRKKLNEEVTFPLYLNMNHFMDSESNSDKQKLAELIAENPLREAKLILQKQAKSLAQERKEIAAKEEAITNETEKRFRETIDNELQDGGVLEGEPSQQSKGA